MGWFMADFWWKSYVLIQFQLILDRDHKRHTANEKTNVRKFVFAIEKTKKKGNMSLQFINPCSHTLTEHLHEPLNQSI